MVARHHGYLDQGHVGRLGQGVSGADAQLLSRTGRLVTAHGVYGRDDGAQVESGAGRRRVNVVPQRRLQTTKNRDG